MLCSDVLVLLVMLNFVGVFTLLVEDFGKFILSSSSSWLIVI